MKSSDTNMTPRNSTRTRRDCFAAHAWEDKGRKMLTCHRCKSPIDPARQAWEADHIRRRAECGDDSPANVWPICIPCHRDKSAVDISEVAKGKRVGERHYGIRRAIGFRKPAGARFDWSERRWIKD